MAAVFSSAPTSFGNCVGSAHVENFSGSSEDDGNYKGEDDEEEEVDEEELDEDDVDDQGDESEPSPFVSADLIRSSPFPADSLIPPKEEPPSNMSTSHTSDPHNNISDFAFPPPLGGRDRLNSLTEQLLDSEYRRARSLSTCSIGSTGSGEPFKFRHGGMRPRAESATSDGGFASMDFHIKADANIRDRAFSWDCTLDDQVNTHGHDNILQALMDHQASHTGGFLGADIDSDLDEDMIDYEICEDDGNEDGYSELDAFPLSRDQNGTERRSSRLGSSGGASEIGYYSTASMKKRSRALMMSPDDYYNDQQNAVYDQSPFYDPHSTGRPPKHVAFSAPPKFQSTSDRSARVPKKSSLDGGSLMNDDNSHRTRRDGLRAHTPKPVQWPNSAENMLPVYAPLGIAATAPKAKRTKKPCKPTTLQASGSAYASYTRRQPSHAGYKQQQTPEECAAINAHNLAMAARFEKLRQATLELSSQAAKPKENIYMTASVEMFLPSAVKPERIGAYNREERVERVERFRQKRIQRVWRKSIKYDCRSKLAETRPRVKGRFVSHVGPESDGHGRGKRRHSRETYDSQWSYGYTGYTHHYRSSEGRRGEVPLTPNVTSTPTLTPFTPPAVSDVTEPRVRASSVDLGLVSPDTLVQTRCK